MGDVGSRHLGWFVVFFSGLIVVNVVMFRCKCCYNAYKT